MRIAFLVNNYPPRSGGVELHVHALAHHLFALGHEVLVVTLGEVPGSRSDRGIRVVTLREHFRVAGILGFPGIGTARRLRRLLREERIDVVSVHTRFFPMSYVGLRAATRVGLPTVHTEHGSDHVASDSFIIRFASRFVDRTLGRYVLRGATRVLSVSEASAEFVQRLSGVSAGVFYNAIEAPSTAPDNWANQPANLVFVGRLVPGKGWETYLDIMATLNDSSAVVTGQIIGDGPDIESARKRVDQLGLRSVVTLRGRLPQHEVRSALRGSTLVNPTILSEGFQTTLLEAIAEGGRVFTYPVPGARLLQTEGAPIHISDSKDPAALERLVLAHLGETWTPMPSEHLDRWTWSERASEYLEHCRAALPSS